MTTTYETTPNSDRVTWEAYDLNAMIAVTRTSAVQIAVDRGGEPSLLRYVIPTQEGRRLIKRVDVVVTYADEVAEDVPVGRCVLPPGDPDGIKFCAALGQMRSSPILLVDRDPKLRVLLEAALVGRSVINPDDPDARYTVFEIDDALNVVIVDGAWPRGQDLADFEADVKVTRELSRFHRHCYNPKDLRFR